jgi:diacylglycerol kinase family enzyme
VRISLLYNVDAGDGVSAKELRRELERSGHELACLLEKDSDFERVLEEPTELVAVAGGDGTVRKVALALAGRGIPLAILPFGTANNIAKSLGIRGSASQVIQRWRVARRLPFDLGIARGNWGQSRCLEGMGGGLIPKGIAVLDGRPRHEKGQDRDSELALALRAYRETLSGLTPRRCALTLDGSRLEGEFLLLEVLNIRSVGPNLAFSPDADPSDGLFDVVTAEEQQRDELDNYLLTRIEGREGRLGLPTLRARHVEVEGWEEMHVDDKVCAVPSNAPVSIQVEPAALEFLV